MSHGPQLLVTGATGFVGQVLVAEALRRGLSIRAALRVMGAPMAGGLEPVIVGALDQAVDWRQAVAGVHTVIHLAGRAHAPRNQGAAALQAFQRINVEATAALAQAAIEAGVRRLVYVSSVKAVGNATLPGQVLSDSSTPHPTDAYGQSKLAAEQTLAAIAARGGMEWVVIRPPLVHGPGVKGHLARLTRWVDRGWPLPLAGLENRRSVVGVHNLVDALLCVAHHPAAAGQRFFVRDDEDLSTPMLVHRIAQAMDRPARLFAVPPMLSALAMRLPGSDVLRRLTESLQVDASPLTRLTGWRATVSVDEGMRRMVHATARD